MANYISFEEECVIKELIRRGLLTSEIQVKTGCSRNKISAVRQQMLKSGEFVPQHKKKVITKEIECEAKKLKDLKPYQIAAKLGISETSARRLVKEINDSESDSEEEKQLVMVTEIPSNIKNNALFMIEEGMRKILSGLAALRGEQYDL